MDGWGVVPYARRVALCFALLIAAPTQLHAQVQSPGALPEPDAFPSAHWSESKARLFVAGLADAGALARAKLTLGYGKPHWTWIGVESENVTTTEVGLTAVRARLSLLVADFAIAYRKTWSYKRGFFDREARYSDGDLGDGPSASYTSLDMWLWGILPIGKGYVDWETEAIQLLDVPPGKAVYEEWLRVPARPPWLFAARLGYAHTFIHGKLAVGVIGEWVHPGRKSLWRVGPMASYAFSAHWDVAALVNTPVESADELGIVNGLWGTLRVRFRFATGDKRLPSLR